MVDKNDVETARELGGISVRLDNIDSTLENHDDRIKEIEKCQQALNNSKKAIVVYITGGAFVVFVLSSGVFSHLDPATGKEILKSLIPLFTSAAQR